MEAEIAALISSVGFPIVAFYLMYRMVNGTLKECTQAIKNNTELIAKMLGVAEVLRQMKEGEISGE